SIAAGFVECPAWLRTRHTRGIAGSLADNNPIHALAVRLLRLQPEPELLAHHGGQEGAHRVRLPAGGVRSSSATAPRLPDAGQSSAPQLARLGISRFPSKELLHMPGSSTTPGRSDLAMVRPKRVAFRARNSVGTRGLAFAAQWLAYALPYRR